MGRFSTTVHIQNNADRIRLVNTFCDIMKKRGFAPCKEDEAAASYILSCGEGGWTTLANEDYRDNPKKAYDDSQQIASAMKTSAFSVEVVDSDFAVLKLFGGNYSDEVVVGDGSGYGIEEPSRGNRDCWEPLLAGGKKWEEFTQTAEKENTFVEDTLSTLAEILGIAPDYICADYSELSEGNPNENLIQLHFKKAKEKSMTLNAAFIKVFGEGLESFGFKRLKKIKNKYPYYVRVVNGEILNIITYRQLSSSKLGYKSIEVSGGVVTLYRRDLDFETGRIFGAIPIYNYFRSVQQSKRKYNVDIDESVLDKAVQFYCDIWGLDKETVLRQDPWVIRKDKRPPDETSLDSCFRQANMCLMCKSDDSEKMLEGMENAFNITKATVLPIFDQINSIEVCAEWFFNGKLRADIRLCPLDEFITNEYFCCSEGLTLIKANYRNDGIEEMEREVAHRIKDLTAQEEIDRMTEKIRNEHKEQIALRFEMLDNPEIHKRVMEELQRCKENNIEALRYYGIEI